MHPETKMLQQHININVAMCNTKKIIIELFIIIDTRSRVAYTTQEIVTKIELVTQTIRIVHP